MSAGATLDIPNSDGLQYTVRRGDTLQGIARTWGVELNGVLDWNRLTSSVIGVADFIKDLGYYSKIRNWNTAERGRSR